MTEDEFDILENDDTMEEHKVWNWLKECYPDLIATLSAYCGYDETGEEVIDLDLNLARGHDTPLDVFDRVIGRIRGAYVDGDNSQPSTWKGTVGIFNEYKDEFDVFFEIYKL